MIAILQKDHKILRQKAAAVPLDKINGAKIKKIIADMKKALASQADGVAVAAPQIGAALRIFAVSGRVFDPDFRRGEANQKKKTWPPDLVFINPRLVKLSKEKKWLLEGCLSVRPWWGEVRRSTRVVLEAYDETGRKITRGASGLLAQIFQHEADHLEGVLFIDKARNLKKDENLLK